MITAFHILILVAAIIIWLCVFVLRTVIHAYTIVLLTEYDGKKVLENEKYVIKFLENVFKNHSDFSMKAFDRKAISHKVKKTPTTTHCFFVINNKTDGTYHTLSFSATSKWATSKGAWAMDTGPDVKSYADYLSGNNIWEIKEIMTNNGISTSLTIGNILSKTRKGITYYFLAKANKNEKYDNCNTALFETIVENDFISSGKENEK